jgi:hypothetical protein
MLSCQLQMFASPNRGKRPSGGDMDVAETESRLPADGALSSCNRISITGTYFASFFVRPNLRPNKRMIVKGKFPLGSAHESQKSYDRRKWALNTKGLQESEGTIILHALMICKSLI